MNTLERFALWRSNPLKPKPTGNMTQGKTCTTLIEVRFY